MGDRIYNVLFLCTGNSARSILAEAPVEQWDVQLVAALPVDKLNRLATQRRVDEIGRAQIVREAPP